MAKTYAWSNFPVEHDEKSGQVTKTIKAGEPISQSDLGVSDEEWAYLLETGAVSEEEYPDVPPTVSPAEYQAQQESAAIQLGEARLAVEELTTDAETQPPTPTPGTTGAKAKE